MRITISGKTYIIGWHHIRETVHDRRTACHVSEILPDKKLKTIVQGEAYCNIIDNYEKNKGRKISLTRALKQSVPDPNNGNAEWRPLFSKEEKKAIWEQYFKMRQDRW